MSKTLYLINPRPPVTGYTGGDAFERMGMSPASLIGDLAVPTVAALVPRDFEVRLCDELSQEVDLEFPSDYVGLTGKVSQFPRMAELAREFRRRGRTVIVGGPFASLSPERVRPLCDVLVRGELESIAESFFDDLRAGTPKAEYWGEPAALTSHVLPRWDLFDSDYRSCMGAVQTSRGCPYECDYCDVIVYLGRKQRHKPAEHVVEEVEALYDQGYRQIFLADDNLTVHRRRAKELMSALRDWNAARTDGHVIFSTQLSIDLSRDIGLLDLCADAGLQIAFIGIETPNRDSLLEVKKTHNLGDMRAEVDLITRHGVAVSAGMMVGFDHDGPDIFARQLAFVRDMPVPQVTLSLVTAPEATPLYDRMEREGRLLHHDPATQVQPFGSNVAPLCMTDEQRTAGCLWLTNQLYAPENFTRRMLRMIELIGADRDPDGLLLSRAQAAPRPIDLDALQLITRIPSLGEREARMYQTILAAATRRPHSLPYMGGFLMLYLQTRTYLEDTGLWDPELGGPEVEAPGGGELMK